MGRTRAFDEAVVLRAAAEVFVRGGYEATSVDDLVTALGVHRGSLYNAFGSKRGLFLKALDRHVEDVLGRLGPDPAAVREELVRGGSLDLVLVAAIERGADDPDVATTVRAALALVQRALGGAPGTVPDRALSLLGARLHARLADRAGPPTS